MFPNQFGIPNVAGYQNVSLVITVSNEYDFAGLNAWENEPAPGENRSVMAARIRDVVKKDISRLDFRGCSQVTSCPPLPDIEHIDLSGCTLITTLPPMPKAEQVDLRGCTSLRTAPEMPLAHTVDLSGCSSLTTMTEIPKAEHVDLSGCTSLPAVPPMPNAKNVNLSGCTLITTVPPMPKAERINLSECTSLPAVPPMPKGERINLSGCILLQTVPAMPNAERINLSRCTLLVTMHETPNAERMDVSGCILLRTLPQNLENLRHLDVTGCVALNVQRANLPPDVRVIGLQAELPYEVWYRKAGKPQTETDALKVAWDNLKTTPFYNAFESLLNRLGENQLKDRVSATDVAEVIEQVVRSPEIRATIFNLVQTADQDCHDRPLSVFYDAQCQARFSKLEQEGASVADLLKFTNNIRKTLVLDEVALQVMTKQWKEEHRTGNADRSNANFSESLEVQLALREALKEPLGLPFSVSPIYAQDIAKLNKDDLDFALEMVGRRMADKENEASGLVALPVWSRYLEHQLKDEIAAINTKYGDQLNKLAELGQSDCTNTQMYLNQSTALMHAKDAEVHQLLIQHTERLMQENS